MTGVICTLFKFQSVLISDLTDLYMLVRFGDVYCRYCSHLKQWLQSNWLFCWFYPPQLCHVCYWSPHNQFGSRNSTGFLSSYFQVLVLVGVGTMICISPCSSSKRTWMYLQTLSWHSRYFVGERPWQPDMMWWMVSFLAWQIRHVSSSSILKTFFNIFGGICLFLDGGYCWLCSYF